LTDQLRCLVVVLVDLFLLRREKSRSSWQLFCSVCVTVRILEDDDE
jgi:hypothetical protein